MRQVVALSSLTQKIDENSAMTTGEKEKGRGPPIPFSQKTRHIAPSTKGLESSIALHFLTKAWDDGVAL